MFPLAQLARQHRRLVLPIFVRPSFERHEVDKRRYDHALDVVDRFDGAGIRLMEILNDRGYTEASPQPQAAVWERMNTPIARGLRGLIYVLWELSQVDPSDLSMLFAGPGRLRLGFADIDAPAGEEPGDAEIERAAQALLGEPVLRVRQAAGDVAGLHPGRVVERGRCPHQGSPRHAGHGRTERCALHSALCARRLLAQAVGRDDAARRTHGPAPAARRRLVVRAGSPGTAAAGRPRRPGGPNPCRGRGRRPGDRQAARREPVASQSAPALATATRPARPTTAAPITEAVAPRSPDHLPACSSSPWR